jgi:2-polyprenyl-3-methyl-5-hydroxy-6-metoxy-1,4-benzoquinol methylase
MTTDYQTVWRSWDDMIRYSPAPFHRRRLMMAMARSLRFASVLDVGCGTGETLAAFVRAFGVRGTGVDVASGAVEEARRRLPQAEFRALDIEQAHLGRAFDLVLCSEVLEHCARLDDAIANLRAMTAGHLIVTVTSWPRYAPAASRRSS